MYGALQLAMDPRRRPAGAPASASPPSSGARSLVRAHWKSQQRRLESLALPDDPVFSWLVALGTTVLQRAAHGLYGVDHAQTGSASIRPRVF